MLREDRTDGGGRRPPSRNVFGEPLEICSIKPMTGFYRDGCCNTGREDFDSHYKSLNKTLLACRLYFKHATREYSFIK